MRNKKGQTLVEVLVALLFVAVSVIALIRFQHYLSYGTNLIQQKAFATTLAVKEIETLRDFQVLNNISGYTSYQGIASGTSTTTGTSATYTVAWTVTANTNPTYKNADVTVSWVDSHGSTQSIRVVSNIAGIDPQNSSAIM
ncbi:MAG: hypothetical protein A3E83_00400 [Gammaproteobacteria bacterium RIFCSPHIGHO2_12_FULL_41_20]|nr:MAG: hypothetical protein A3E83_00400 [Gammaproteobacteria bacterium RIFCSPHIGHO2_12_FULL_41_20]